MDWEEILARLAAGESIQDVIPPSVRDYVEVGDTLTGRDRQRVLDEFTWIWGYGPDAGLGERDDLPYEPFTQQGIKELISNPVFTDSLASVRQSLPLTLLESGFLSGEISRDEDLDNAAYISKTFYDEPLEIRNFGDRRSIGGEVLLHEPNVIHMNIMPTFAPFTGAAVGRTKEDWNRPPEDRYRDTLLHELWHSSVDRYRDWPLTRDNKRSAERNANEFAAGFNALAQAEPGDTRKDIVDRGVKSYLEYISGWKDTRPISDRPEDRRIREVIEDESLESDIETMIGYIAEAPVFSDNPWNFEEPEPEEEPSFFDQVISTLQTTGYGLKHLLRGNR